MIVEIKGKDANGNPCYWEVNNKAIDPAKSLAVAIAKGIFVPDEGTEFTRSDRTFLKLMRGNDRYNVRYDFKYAK
jgi:hypothetical protein